MFSRVMPAEPVVKSNHRQQPHKPLGSLTKRQTPNHFDDVFKAALKRS